MLVFMALLLWILYRKENDEKIQAALGVKYSSEAMVVLEQERSRIATELHDTLAQELRALSIECSRQHLGALVKNVDTLISKTREICGSLVPPDFGREDLAGGLDSLCRDFSARTGIAARFVSGGADREQLPKDADTKLHIYRIVQEALTNIEKHSGATEAVVSVRAGADIYVFISDNGIGIKENYTDDDYYTLLRDRRFGLWGMRQRAVLLGGALQFTSSPGEGTMITLRIKKE
jgi:signal transduction histidine kinase